MRYMVFVKMADDVGPAPQALFEVMGREMGALFASGVMVDAGGLGPGAAATEVRLKQGRVSVTDGPFTEAKEVVGGYSIVDVGSREEAVAMARRVIEIHRDYWPGWEGSAEVRRLDEPQLEGGE
jgi:hypothetical protein